MESETISILSQAIEKLVEAQEAEKDWVDVWLTPFTALTGVVLTAVLSYFLGFRTQVRISELRTRQESFGSLMGYKFSLSQLYVSRFEARIFSDYHEERWKLTGGDLDSIDLEEAKRWMEKSEDLSLFIAEKNEQVFRTIGLIKAVFPQSKELDALVSRIYEFKVPQIHSIPDGMNLEELESWKGNAVSQLQELVKNEISLPLDTLLEHLQTSGKLKSA